MPWALTLPMTCPVLDLIGHELDSLGESDARCEVRHSCAGCRPPRFAVGVRDRCCSGGCRRLEVPDAFPFSESDPMRQRIAQLTSPRTRVTAVWLLMLVIAQAGSAGHKW